MFTIDPQRYTIWDISALIEPGRDPYRPFDMTRGRLADDSYKFDITRTHSHVGTHVESSSHFFDDGKTIDQYDLSAFHGRGVLLHVDLPDYERDLTAAYAEQATGGRLGEQAIVVLRNAHEDDPARKKFLSADAARLFARHRAKMVVFGPNISMGETVAAGRLIHDILMRETTFLEILGSLKCLTRPEFYVMALPILIQGIESSWARAIVIEDK